MAERKSTSQPVEAATQRRPRRVRRFPVFHLKDALVLAQSIFDNNAGKPYSRFSLAESIRRSPDASQFRDLITSSSAYGLTEGGYKAPTISLTNLGWSIVSPRSDAEKQQALIEAAMNIELFAQLYRHFDQHKIPQQDNLKNTLIRDHGLDPDQVEACISHFRSDGLFVGLIRNVSGSDRVIIEGAGDSSPSTEASPVEDVEPEEERIPDLRLVNDGSKSGPQVAPAPSAQRVFITHGKNHEIVEQLKELLKFGKLVPVVAEEQETPSKPVPDKVMDAMRSCFAGIIHVSSEAELLDKEGQIHHKINENVLIEIGAALALYGKNFILLVQKGIHLPSNLQGLYRCEYEGSKLDYEATMKLLKAFNEFK